MTLTYTPVKASQWKRSAKAHQAAESQFYAGMWPGASLAFTDHTGTSADTKFAIDYSVDVKLAGWVAPFKFWVQERWRDPANYHAYHDATVTSWNRNSNTPSELFHFGAGIFVYGYYDEQLDEIAGAFAYDAARMLFLLTRGKISSRPVPSNDRNQEAVGLDRRQLWVHGCLLHHMKNAKLLDGTFPGEKAAEGAEVPGLG